MRLLDQPLAPSLVLLLITIAIVCYLGSGSRPAGERKARRAHPTGRKPQA